MEGLIFCIVLRKIARRERCPLLFRVFYALRSAAALAFTGVGPEMTSTSETNKPASHISFDDPRWQAGECIYWPHAVGQLDHPLRHHCVRRFPPWMATRI